MLVGLAVALGNRCFVKWLVFIRERSYRAELTGNFATDGFCRGRALGAAAFGTGAANNRVADDLLRSFSRRGQFSLIGNLR